MYEPTNEDRAERAEAAIAAYCDYTGDTPDESHFRDLLSDMMHLAARDGAGEHMDGRRMTFDEALAQARNCYLDEGGGDDADSYRCTGCGRPEEDCSADPCAGVLADRGEADDVADDEGEREARAVLESLGFTPEFAAGHGEIMSRHFDSGRWIWATAEGGGFPSTSSFLICVYPAHDDEAEAEESQEAGRALADAAAAMVEIGAKDDPFALPPSASDEDALFQRGALVWTWRMQRQAIASGWGIQERKGGELFIQADEENRRFSRWGEEGDAEAARHIAFVNDPERGASGGFSDRYRTLCSVAAAIVGTAR